MIQNLQTFRECARSQLGIHRPKDAVVDSFLHVLRQGDPLSHECHEHVGQFVTFQSAEQKQSYKGGVLLVFLEEGPSQTSKN